MPNYQNSKIYKLICNETTDIYIGSTTLTLRERFELHKSDYIHRKSKNFGSNVLFDTDIVSIKLIENYPCDNNEELIKREQYYIDSLDCVNKQNAFTSKEQKKLNDRLRLLNPIYKEKHQIAKKKYRATEKGQQTEKNYKETHREIYRQSAKKYLEKNKDKVNEKKRIKVECPHCKKVMNKNSLSTHLKRKHISI